MEILFLAVVMGCSDDFSVCDEVASYEIAAQSPDACAELTLSSSEVARIDYPAVLAECRVVEEPMLVAEGVPAQ